MQQAKQMGRLLSVLSLRARRHIGIVAALITVIPVMAFYVLLQVVPDDMDAAIYKFIVAGMILSIVGLGYVLLLRYPANISRLRLHLESLVSGKAADQLHLLEGLDDFAAIERSLNMLVEQLTSQKHRMKRELDEIRRAAGVAKNSSPSPLTEPIALGFAGAEGASGGSTARLISAAVGKEPLTHILKCMVEPMGMAVAVFEKDGSLAAGLAQTEWCRHLSSVRSLDRTPASDVASDQRSGAISPCYLSWWDDAASVAVDSGETVEVEARCGARLCAVPVTVGQETVGACVTTCMAPPRDDEVLPQVAKQYGIALSELKKKSQAYRVRPPIVEKLARQRLTEGRDLIGHIIGCHKERCLMEEGGRTAAVADETLDSVVEERSRRLRQENAKLRQEVVQRQRSEQAKDEFVNTASHELRAPLCTMQEGLAVLREKIAGPLTDKQERVLGMVQSSIDRLLRMVSDLLDVSRIEAGRIVLNRTKVNVVDTVQQVVSVLDAAARLKGLNVSVEADRDEAWVYADEDRLTQVLMNLGNNALKYTEEGTVTFTITASREDVTCSVVDTGIGIRSEDLPRLFDKYSQFSTHART
ncbi:MAG: HAMP domain-containing histidine kinase, partial [Candidatus Pacebacteria bacterium]|nr:HAMP domain-containing histidine kinase [Candidatus Paceibacterota bacterium]